MVRQYEILMLVFRKRCVYSVKNKLLSLQDNEIRVGIPAGQEEYE